MNNAAFEQPRQVVLYFFVGLFCFLLPATGWGADGQQGSLAHLSINGISASIGEDEPRVLTILPWQAPTLSRRPRAELESTAPELVRPLDPKAFEVHQAFRQRLNHRDTSGPGGRR